MSIIYVIFYIDDTRLSQYNNGTVKGVASYLRHPHDSVQKEGMPYGNFKSAAESDCKLCKKGI